ncbi:MAG: tetratricopeptide repeat protein [Deltaproteobacteria bacterium]|nr:tetratricopeptide repeat protein [Deltaproteobacteria bacterium]
MLLLLIAGGVAWWRNSSPDFFAVMSTGESLARDEKYAEALKQYAMCLEMKPRDVDVLNNVQYVAEQATEKKDFDTAIDAYQTLIAQTPTAAFYDALGKIYGKELGDLPKAQAYLENGLAIDPANSAIIAKLGIVYAMTGNVDKSIELFDRAIAIDPTDAGAYFNKGRALRQTGRIAEGDQLMAKARQMDPNLETAPDPERE